MDRDTALKLLRGEEGAIAEWNQRRKSGEEIPDLHHADLHDANLCGADFRGANLTGANLAGADVSGAKLGGAYLGAANLGGAKLGEAYLFEVNLSGADLNRANLTGAKLTGANLRGAKLGGANLGAANLSRTDFRDSDLNSANLGDAELGHADLSGAKLGRAKLVAANLRGATLRGAHLVEANLSLANLGVANLSETNLDGANLGATNLRGATLRGATLRGARLLAANFSRADLSGADLSGTDLGWVNLTGADLSAANLGGATCRLTVFANVDLSDVKGLDSVIHYGPSSIGIDTLLGSRGKIPEAFLLGCGVPKPLIEYIRSLIHSMQPIQLHSCFLSYAVSDEDFATKLHADLESVGTRCWKWDHDARIGQPLWGEIDKAIPAHDKLILIASEASLKSPQVNREIERALQEEDKRVKLQQEGKYHGDTNVLFPVRLDDYVFKGWNHHRKADVTTKVIGDARGWNTSPESYRGLFDRLTSSLKAESSVGLGTE
jgi:uncharacterized protein YjbI with pentapeptide repeats